MAATPVSTFLYAVAGRLARRVLGWLVVVWACLAPSLAQAQDEDDDETGTSYEREFNYGVNFNTNGGLIGGVAFKYAWQRKPGWYNRVYMEIVHLKHPKEYRARGAISSFIPDKYEYLFAIRPSFGQEYVLFSKAPEEGVQLNAIFGAGPTFGITKPYYVLYDANYPSDGIATSVPYTTDLNKNNIVGVGRVTDGFDQLGFIPGFHVRGGLNFEYGRARGSVVGIEGGFVAEIYAKQVQLLKFDNSSSSSGLNTGLKNPQSFLGLYLLLYYGSKH